MKLLISLICLVSLNSYSCGVEFPSNLECRDANTVDSDLVFEFTKVNKKTVKMNIFEMNIAGKKLVAEGNMKIRKHKLKSKLFKAKFSKDFKKLKVFKADGSLDRSNFTCN